MENDEILDLKSRREIYDFISKNPGLHMRDISRKLNIPFSTLKYHLNYLEKKKLIISKTDGKYCRYFISLEIGETEKKVLYFFRKRITLHMILWFIITMQCTQKDLARFCVKHPTTIGFHLRKLMRAGIIEEVPIEGGFIRKDSHKTIIKRSKISSEKIFVLKDHWMIFHFLVKHKDNLQDKSIVNGIINYVEFYISKGVPPQIQSRDDTIDSVFKALNSFFFPPSFCQ